MLNDILNEAGLIKLWDKIKTSFARKDEVYTKSEIDERHPDWQESNEESPSFILRRTHYEGHEEVALMIAGISSGYQFDYPNSNIEINVGDKFMVIDGNGNAHYATATRDGRSEQWVDIVFSDIDSYFYYMPGNSYGNGEWNGETSYLPQQLYKLNLKQLDSKYVKVDNQTLVIDENDIIKVGSTIARTSQIPTVDQHYNSSSANPQSGTAVAEALEPIEDVIPSSASSTNQLVDNDTFGSAISSIEDVIPSAANVNNKLVDFELLVDSIQQQTTEYISSDASMVVAFEHCTAIGDQRSNLEQGPWFKDFVECGVGSPAVYVTENDYAVVLQDESVCYFEAYGYRYQRHKDGGATPLGYVVLPDANHTTTRIEETIYQGNQVMYFVDTTHTFSENDIYFVVSDRVVLKDSVLELSSLSDTTPIHTYDLNYPSTRYVCTESQSEINPTPTWSFAYFINDTALTGAQMQALNSGINSTLVNQITLNQNAISSLATVARTGSYNDLLDAPSKLSEFENDVPYIARNVIEEELDDEDKVNYRQVYYIESSGAQYIRFKNVDNNGNLDIYPNEDTGFYIDYVSKWNTKTSTGADFYFSAGLPKGTRTDHFQYSAYTNISTTYKGEMKINGFEPTNRSSNPNFDPTNTLNERHQIEYKNKVLKNYNTNSTTDISSQISQFTSAYELVLFAANGVEQTTPGVASRFAKMKLFQYKIFDGSDVILNLIPVVRRSDEKPGLFDVINKHFYINEGSGDDFNYEPKSDDSTTYFTLSNICKDIDYATPSDIGTAKITIQKNGSAVGNFNVNQVTDKSINITVPTTVAELTDAANYVQTTDFTADTTDWDYIMGNSNN